MKYSSIITNRGAELNTEAVATGIPLKLAKFVIGDGGGQAIEPNPFQTKLAGERYREDIGQLMVSQEHQEQLVAVLPVPETVGGFTVREAGLLTDRGELYAVCNLAAIEKPENGVAITLQFHLSASAKAAVNITTSSGTGLFLRVSEDLSEIKAKGAKAQENVRINIGLGSAAVNDVQLSRDDVTAGRVLMNGGALAIRSTRAQRDPSPGNVADANQLPANSVSFVYSNVPSAPVITGSLLDFSGGGGGYSTQIVGAYGGGGNRIVFRTRDGDRKNWNPWFEFYHTGNKPTPVDVNCIQDGSLGMSKEPPAWNAKSGMYNLDLGGHSQMIFNLNMGWGSCPGAQFKFDYKNGGVWYRTPRDKFGFEKTWAEFYTTDRKPTPAELGVLPIAGGTMTGAITGIYKESSSWADQYKTKAPFFDDYTSAAVSAYRPLIKQRATTSGNSWAFSMGTLLSAGALSWHLHIKGSSGLEINHRWATDGNYYSAGQLIPRNYANFDTRYYTRAAADAKFPVSIRRGARSLLETDGKLVEAPEGCILTGGNGNEGDQIGYHYYRPLQILRNGIWMTIEDVPK